MFRRDFLKNLGVFGAAVAAPVSLVNASTTPIPDLNTTLLKGRVTSKNMGIEGVAVTDGINITHTNNNGQYELLSNKTCRFVYISLPSGYEIPQDRGLAKFFKKIDHSQSGYVANFELNKLAYNDNKHAFVVWADTQIISKEDAELLKTQASPDLKALAASYPKEVPLHGIGCGDLVWDKFDLYPDYKDAIAATGVTFFNVIGNHDMDLNARTDEYSGETFQQHFGPTYYSFNRGKIHYIVLDDVFFIGASKKYIGYLTENQLQWLEQDLKSVAPGNTIVLSLHIPSNTGHKRRYNLAEEEMGGVVMNRKRLYELLKPFNIHIMSGHTHYNEVWEEGNLTEHVHGTVCGAWWTGPICSDGTPNGYGVYEVDGNNISWFYKSTGKPNSHQIRIYPKEDKGQEEVIINIWNWDKHWKTTWFEDGKFKGNLQQFTGLDPWASKLYTGKSLPVKHPFVEPTITDHLFMIKPSPGTKKIKVVATDRFGNTFQEEMGL